MTSLEAGRPEEARRGPVAGTQDRARGERLLDEGHQKTQVWGNEGSFEDKNTGQARQAFWAGLGVRVGHGTSVLPWLWLLWWPVSPSVIFLTVKDLHDSSGERLGSHGSRAKNPRKGERN